MKTEVVIVGGGISGLTCAAGLLDTGLDLLVIEADTRLGGRAGSLLHAATGDTIDLGPHVFTSEHRNMLRLLRRLGTGDQVVWHTDNFLVLLGDEPLVMKRYPLPAPLSLLPNLFRVASLSAVDLASNTAVVLFAMRLDEEQVCRLDDTTACEFLRRMGVTPRFIDWFWRSLAITLMNVPLEECSAGALMRVYSRLMVDNRFRFGFPATALADLFAPAAARRIQAAGGRILTGRAVRGFAQANGALSAVLLDDGTRVETRFCVAAIPPQELARVVPERWAEAHACFRRLDAFVPVPYLSTFLWFDRRLTMQQMWSRLWSPGGLNYDFYDLANIRPAWRGRSSVIASNIIDSRQAQSLSDPEIITVTRRELSHYLPQAATASLLHAAVHRLPMAITAPHPGAERNRPDTRTPIHGLFLAGDWTNTHYPACMESAARSGWLAAEAIREAVGKPKRLASTMAAPGGIPGVLRWFAGRRAAEPPRCR